MDLLKLFLDIVYKGFVTFGVIAVLFLSVVTIADVVAKYDTVKQQEEQLQELYDQQAYVLQLIKEYQQFNSGYINAIADDFSTQRKTLNQEIDKLNKIEERIGSLTDQQKADKQKLASAILELKSDNEKPSYEYLTSVTTYMFQPEEELNIQETLDNGLAVMYEGKTVKGSVGTGTIVAKKHGYFYILTNKHVCDKGNDCKIILTDTNEFIDVTFVKRVQSKYDLSLWRTKANLPNKKAINGFAMSYPQDKIFSAGHYLGNPYIYTEGTFGGYQNDVVLFNMSCAPGCSGSGVFDVDGNIIGVVFAGNKIGAFQMDTAKILGINGDVIQLFLKEFIDE